MLLFKYYKTCKSIIWIKYFTVNTVYELHYSHQKFTLQTLNVKDCLQKTQEEKKICNLKQKEWKVVLLSKGKATVDWIKRTE